jgi:hypothetical protein
LSVGPQIEEHWGRILPGYPDAIREEDRREVEPLIRAVFLSCLSLRQGSEEEAGTARQIWARTFWRSNWKLYKCDTRPLSGEASKYADRSDVRQARSAWLESLELITGEFLEVARTVDPDLYFPDKYEVLTGIAFRVLKDIVVLINDPGLWTMEHGAGYIRSLVEARIVLRWLIQNDEPRVYSKFKDYGRGRLKLFKLHLEEYRDELKEPRPDLDAHI